MWQDSSTIYTHVTWLVCDSTHIRDMTHKSAIFHAGILWIVARTLCVTWLIHIKRDSFICDMPHSHVMQLIHVSHDSQGRDLWRWLLANRRQRPRLRPILQRMCIWDMTRSHTWHDSFIYTTRPFHLCLYICRRHLTVHPILECVFVWDISRSHTWHDSYIYTTWLTHMCLYICR